MTADELSERYALVKKLKSELKNEEMALVLLKKLKQSQTIQREATTVGGGATLTPANKTGSKEKAMFSNKNSDHAMAKELVSNTFTSDLQVVDSCLSEQHAVEVFDGRVDEQLVERELAGRGGHRRASPLPDERELLAAAAEAEGVAETKARAGDEGKPSTTTSRRQARSQETAGEDLAAGGEILLTIILVIIVLILQIPPPKPPPPEMHFIPNPANTEFIYLTGLEECVNRILNLDAVPPAMPTPFSCSQCGTDFTPTWKWDKAAKGKQIVEI